MARQLKANNLNIEKVNHLFSLNFLNKFNEEIKYLENKRNIGINNENRLFFKTKNIIEIFRSYLFFLNNDFLNKLYQITTNKTLLSPREMHFYMDPPRADLRLGYLCNNNCIFCCVGHQRKFNLSTKKVKEELDFAKQNGSEKVVFTGGEPTVRKDIFELVAYANKLKFKDILIITNGRMCSYPGFLEKLITNGLTSITYSLPDIRENIYEKLTQVKGSYKQLKNAFKELEKFPQLMFATITTITKYNYKYLPEITKFLVELHKKQKRMYSEFMFINPTDNAWEHRQELVPKISDVAPYVHSSLDYAKKHNFMLNVEAIPFCYMQNYEQHVVELHMAKERVYLDPEQKADFNFNENRKNKGKIKSVNCRGCIYDDICEGLWKNYADIYGLSEFKAIKIKKQKFKLLQIGSPCNQDCVFCSMLKYMKEEIPGFTKRKIYDNEIEDYGVPLKALKEEITQELYSNMMIVGGEPTIRKDLPEIIDFAKRMGVKEIGINTNAVRLSNIEYLKKLKNAGLTKTYISFHSHKEELSEQISQRKGHYKKIIQGINNSFKLGLKVNFIHVIFKDNYFYLEEFAQFISNKFPKIKSVDFVFIKANSTNNDENKLLVPKITTIIPELKKAIKILDKNSINITVSNIPLCLMPGFEDKNLQTLELLELKIEEPFKKWMNNRNKNKEKEKYGYKDEKCRNCQANQYCVGLIKEYYDLYGTDELKPISKDKIEAIKTKYEKYGFL